MSTDFNHFSSRGVPNGRTVGRQGQKHEAGSHPGIQGHVLGKAPMSPSYVTEEETLTYQLLLL